MIGVIFLLLAATVFSHYRDSTIDRRIDDILDNAMPGVQRFAGARGDLRRLCSYVPEYVESARHGRRLPPTTVAAYRQQIQGTLEGYRELPTHTQEGTLFQSVSGGLRGLDDAIRLALSKPDSGDDAITDVRRQCDLTDDALRRLVELQATKGAQLGLAILKVRRAAMMINALCIGLSILALGLAAWMLRRTVRELEAEKDNQRKQTAQMTVRAEELGLFAGRVAHDVLSPLSGISIAMQFVDERMQLEGSPRVLFDRGRACLSRIQQTVNGLLAFARAGAQPEPGAHADLRVVAEEVVDMLRGEAEEKRVELTLKPFESVKVRCSPGVLTSLLSNPLRNSLKYMGDAEVRKVEVRMIDIGKSIRMDVEDTGPGVAPGMEQAVFQPYVRAAGSSQGSIGLGLSTMKRLSEAHGGRVGLHTSQANKCCVWFELPKAQPEGAEGAGNPHDGW